ncbi:BREX-1 system adenine-specific DNA-methyltransferase PglX [Sinirhodobacter sp. WL0062]|uniref:site-specific DNA-methyltransferase (adenine-specific) n=1 Tax=Rhodobacter flavimaris TaxID=2907145 RepID=A0ABS8YVI2_9RHOB|nr:BREX-1 system adenine-specific DNA-methyltransferase PglX [Sinirhodobacter sp. WL0062]MCE5972446.1 BREX-1 system adenine-specific DNA-methyltransferase PglX [Sinirhodobacter sp. WL0062]
MDTNALKKFAQAARNLLIDQVTAKLAVVIDPASSARRENPAAMKKLDAAIREMGKQQVMEQVAYTWFNRFTALRFMDVNGYTNPRVVSPEGNATRPEILAEAMAGNLPEGASATIAALLDGRSPSRDPQGEAYRMLLVHACNAWHKPMPFMFEKVGDYTELLMPEDLLSPTSILARLRDAMPEDACQDVEIIGWLYQFYISEKKDQVFAALKKNKKIEAENIPAATQLFTPHWIVRYLVENSLGRLWLLNRPGSKLAERMDYYIAPEEPETDFLKIGKPEEIKVCDPACGSGHMLTYAFDLLYAIYEEEGYEADKIPALILANNLTGVEIDDRAGALAAFALAMKAAAKLGRRRFLRMEAKPDICVLQDVKFTEAEMRDVAAVVGKDLFTDELRETLWQFEQAKNFGSLIVPKLRDPAETLRVVVARDFDADLLLRPVLERLAMVLRTAEALSPKYHVVVANPPYMGGKGMNGKLGDFLKDQYSDVKSDLFSAFVIRNTKLALRRGELGFMTPFVWMFISSYEKLRLYLLERAQITSLIQLEYSGFDGATVPICTFTVKNLPNPEARGAYIRLANFRGAANQAPRALEAIRNPDCGWFYRTPASSMMSIPGSPIAYWVSPSLIPAFQSMPQISEYGDARQGMATMDNDRFLRFWPEVSNSRTELYATSREESKATGCRWFPYNKGGGFRKWYGMNENLVNWENDGAELIALASARYGSPTKRIVNASYFFKDSITWGAITSSKISLRRCDSGFIFDTKGQCIFSEDKTSLEEMLGFLNSKVTNDILQFLAPTLDFNCGVIAKLPFEKRCDANVQRVAKAAVSLARSDWDAYETSWDFTTLPLLSPDHRAGTLEATYTRLRAHWQSMTDEMQRLEEENNRIFIDAYGLQDELTPEVPVEEITLTCNPAYRYGMKNDVDANETRLRADTMAEFLSYAVGCMFGRYSLDAPGLILAKQGETLADYLARVPNPSFLPDEDNVIPVLDADWFPDDIVDRFRKFLRVTFGEAHFRENLAFIEAQIGDIRKYFAKGFYDDHVKRYKKRPIYWMFSSPKGTFQALIYMHRYRPDTVSVLLNDYLREFIRKLEAERGRLEKLSDDPAATQTQRTKALKDVGVIAKQLAELEEWEREVIFPLAQAKIEIDLDDGVKRNYPLFGAALKPIKGLEAADE